MNGVEMPVGICRFMKGPYNRHPPKRSVMNFSRPIATHEFRKGVLIGWCPKGA